MLVSDLNAECLILICFDKNETYQWVLKEKSQLLRNIECIKVCLQCFSAISLHMLCPVLCCSSVTLRRESLCVSDTHKSIVKLAVSLFHYLCHIPFFARSQQRANQISCTVMSWVHRALLRVPILCSVQYKGSLPIFSSWWKKLKTKAAAK